MDNSIDIMQMQFSRAILKKCSCQSWIEIEGQNYIGLQEGLPEEWIVPLFNCPSCYSTISVKVLKGSELHKNLSKVVTELVCN